MFRNNLKTYLGYGYNLQTPGKVKKVFLKDGDRKGHLFGFGSTRIGKTRLIELMMEQDIRKGYSMVFFDPKGDIDIFSKIVQIAYEENRQDELCLVTPIFPDCSAKMDPLAYYYMPEELVSHVVSGIKAKEEFFINIAYETTFVIILSLLFFARISSLASSETFFLKAPKNSFLFKALIVGFQPASFMISGILSLINLLYFTIFFILTLPFRSLPRRKIRLFG